MSDYYSDYSRTPSRRYRHHHSHQSHNHHHNSEYSEYRHRSNHSKHDTIQKRRQPLESSPFTFFFFIILYSLIQIIFLKDIESNATRPTENELPLASMINKYFDYIPTFNLTSSFTDHPKEILLVSLLIFLIYRILCSTSRSPFTSFLISLMALFDETTYNMIIINPSFGVQLILISTCVIICQNILVLEVFSSIWITYVVFSLLVGFIATFISIEAFPIFIPITVSIVFLSRSIKKSKSSFCGKIFNVIITSIFLVVLCGICFGIVFLAFLLGPPKFVVNEANFKILFSEFLQNRHNISFLLMAPLAIILLFFTDIEFAWLLSFIGCLVFTVLMSFSSVINDLEVQAALTIYYYILCCGFVLTNPHASSFSALILIIYLPVVFYFYVYPI